MCGNMKYILSVDRNFQASMYCSVYYIKNCPNLQNKPKQKFDRF